MFAKVYSGAVYGVNAYEVEIEVNSASGGAVIVVVGLPDTAVKESKDRVTTAVTNSGFHWPRGRTTINLAPADVKKEGPSFDDRALDRYVGKQVKCWGFMVGYTLLAERIKVLPG